MEMLFQQYGLFVSSTLLGASVAGLVRWVARIVGESPCASDPPLEFQRKQKLRDAHWLYRHFQPIVDELAVTFFAGTNQNALGHHMRLAGESVEMRPAELLAMKWIEGVLVGGGVFLLVAPTGFVGFAAALALVVACLYPAMTRHSIVNRSRLRLKRIRLRLPFVVDQIALMMQAGAGFEESLQTAIQDNAEHPLNEELREVLRQIGLGRPREQALTNLRDRLRDDDVSELIFAIVKGQELGTPLSSILQDQANQMRRKRSQWGEKAATEAEVQIVFPGMITMLACLLVIVTPIMLPAVMTFLSE